MAMGINTYNQEYLTVLSVICIVIPITKMTSV